MKVSTRCKTSHDFQKSTSAHKSHNSRGKGTESYTVFHTLDSTPAPDYTLYSVNEENNTMHPMRSSTNESHTPEPDIDFTTYGTILQMAPHMDLKQLLISCAELISEADNLCSPEKELAISASKSLMGVLEKRVSVTGEPLQRLSAYILEGLRSRLLSSGSVIYKKLNCNEPRGSELMSYMHVIYQICPYYKFAYLSANVSIAEAMENENFIHVIDFQIAQGSQWVPFIEALSCRPGGPPFFRLTGIDDPHSAYARGGGLGSVGERLSRVAESCGVLFEFRWDVQLSKLELRHGEALAVNFPYVLHHVPDESVNTMNYRDRLLRLVKSWSPKIVTIVEQESNTNTAGFVRRFRETVDYYAAMFESIDAASARDDGVRVSVEEHCVARDVVNIIACEGSERVERHELFGKWRMRLTMAGFSPVGLSSGVSGAVRDMLKEYSSNYRVAEGNGALYLGWKNRALVTSSAWR